MHFKSDQNFPVLALRAKVQPWLLFCGEQEESAAPAWVASRCASEMGRKVLYDLAQRKDLQKLPLFRLRPPIGYGLKQAFNNEKDVAYTAMSGIGNASKARSLYWNDHPNRSEIIEFIFPVIAIDGRLFRCRLDEQEGVEVSEIQSATLRWNNPITSVIHTLIDVQTNSSIDTFASESFQAAMTLIFDNSGMIIEARKEIVRNRRRDALSE